MRCRQWIFVLVLMAVFVPSGALWAQGFGAPSSSFGESDTERAFETSGTPDAGSKSSGYFVHDQLAKLLGVLGFTLASLTVIWTRRFALRRWILLASVIVLGFILGGMLCPISAVQNVILKASTGYLLLFLVPTATALLVGRLFCGYVCPFGALQELLHVKRLHRTIPQRTMNVLRVVPYVLLAYLVARVLVTNLLTWDGLTPFKAFFTFGGTALALVVSGLFAVLSLVVFRPFCRLFCPLGAWLSLVSRLSPFRIRTEGNCVSCSRCDAVCSSGAIAKGKVRTQDCLLCGDCIRRCPTHTLGFGMRRKNVPPSDTERAGRAG
jgi:polyferredoxin